MWAVPPGFLAALTGAHGYVPTVSTYLGDEKLADIPIEAGRVLVDAASQVRRRAYLTVSEEQWTDNLSPFGVQVRIWVTITAGTTTFPPVPVFTGRVQARSRTRRSGLVDVECWDRFADINDDGFEAPEQAPAGARIAAAITTLIADTHPAAAVTDVTGSTAMVPAALAWDFGDGSRGQAIQKMALAIGCEAFALPDGSFLLRPYPTLDDAPAWSVATGAGGVVVSDVQREDRTGVANRWVITGARTADASTVREVATVTSGPLTYGGAYGHVVEHFFDPMITTAGQAQQAGRAILARVAGLGRQRRVGVIANPALEAGDVLAVITEDGYELHIADSFEVPLTETVPTMDVSSRSTQV